MIGGEIGSQTETAMGSNMNPHLTSRPYVDMRQRKKAKKRTTTTKKPPTLLSLKRMSGKAIFSGRARVEKEDEENICVILNLCALAKFLKQIFQGLASFPFF